MSDIEAVTTLIEDQGKQWNEFQEVQAKRLNNLEAHVRDIDKKSNRPGAGASDLDGTNSEGTTDNFINVKTGDPIPVLSHGEKLTSIERKAFAEKNGELSDLPQIPSFGRVMRGIIMGGRAGDAGALELERKTLGINSDPSGGYTVGGILSSEWIDLLRAQMVLSQAGARTLPMDAGTVTLARVTNDPTVSWHGESDGINDTETTFGAVTMTAKTCVCLVKMSLELSQDSANMEQILESTITNAMANAIDSAGLVGVDTDAAAAPAGVVNLSGRNSVTSIGTPANWDFLVDGLYELLVDNVPMADVGAFVAHPSVWKKMTKLKTGIASDETTLSAPLEVANKPKLWTTAAPLDSGTTATGVIANWRDLLFGVRKDITIQVLDKTFLGSNLEVAVLAYARVDFQATRAASFCTLEGITV